MTIWTEPTTWLSLDIPDETDLNAEWRDNLNYLAVPAMDVVNTNTTDQQFTLNSFIVATGVEVTITSEGGPLVFNFTGTFLGSGAVCFYYVDIYNSTSAASLHGDDGYVMQYTPAALLENVSFKYIHRGLAAGTYTFQIRVRVVTGGTPVFLEKGATVAVPCHFSVYERHTA